MVAAAADGTAGGRRAVARLDPERRRQQIVEAADRVLTGRDPAAVTFEEVAEAAGVSRALVYNYFGDKASLVAAVYLRSLEHLERELEAAVDPDLAPRERLRQLVAGSVRFARTSAAWHLAAGGATLHPAVQAAKRRRVERLAADLGGGRHAALVAGAVVAVLEAATPGTVAGDADPEVATEVLTALLWDGLAGLQAEAGGADGGDRLLGAGQGHPGG